MMKNKWKIVFLIICALFVVSVICMVYVGFLGSERQGECVMVRPIVCTGGDIYNLQGMFSYGPTVYRLWFNGKTSKSGDACEVVYRVTEDRYKRCMN